MRKKRNKDDFSNEVELDLERLAEYIRSLKPGEYVDMDAMVEKCAFKDIDLERLSKRIREIKPGEYIVFDDLIIDCSKGKDNISETDENNE